jgi:hypothetical protein
MAKYQGKRSTYELTVDNTKKIFHAQASGFFSIEDGNSFMSDYDALAKPLKPNTYTLIIDAPELQPSSPEVAAMLGGLLQKYMDIPFKTRYLVTKGNTVAIMQFKRLGKAITGWTESIQYVDELSDAMHKIA